jgi:hypothetical protein
MGQWIVTSCTGHKNTEKNSVIHLPAIQAEITSFDTELEKLELKIDNILDSYCEVASLDQLISMQNTIKRRMIEMKRSIQEEEEEGKSLDAALEKMNATSVEPEVLVNP